MNDYGELLDENTVRFERLLPGPIERVWRYLTDGDKRAEWLCGGDVETQAGGHVDMHFHNLSLSRASEGDIPRPDRYQDRPERMSFTGTVTRCEPMNLLEHSWEFENENSLVCYELKEQGDKVRLVLTHTRLETNDIVLSVSGGWHTHLNVLEDVLGGSPRRPFYRMQTQYEAEYGERARLMRPTRAPLCDAFDGSWPSVYIRPHAPGLVFRFHLAICLPSMRATQRAGR